MVKFIMLRQARRGLYGDVMRTVCIARAQGKGYLQLSLQKDNTRKTLSKIRGVRLQ